jgi:APA family basic amino acid/polyamine antiporter
VVVLYLLVNVAYVYALDAPSLVKLPNDDVDEIARLAVNALFGETAARAAAAALGLCLVAAVSAYLLTGPRVAYAMAVDGVFPGFAARLHRTRETPAPAIVTQTIAAGALVWAGTFRELLDYASVGLALLSGLTIASVFALRQRSNLPHPYRMPLYPLPPLCFLVLTGWTVGYAVYSEIFEAKKMPGPALLSFMTLMMGIPLARFLPNRYR